MIFGTGASASKDFSGLLHSVQAAIDGGIRMFDTAPSYRTEALLGKVLHQIMNESDLPREELFIQTKIDAWQMQETNGNIEKHLESVLREMHLDYLDSMLIHWPLPEYLENTWRCFVKLRRYGIIKRIGICNVRMRQLNRFLDNIIMPEIIQIERHPLRTCENEISFCKKHGIIVQAYSPLCKMDTRIRDSADLKSIAEKYQKSIGQTVLRWHLDTGTIPVFTSTKLSRISEYTNIMNFNLSKADIDAISSMNIDYKMYLESCACPGF